MVPTDLVPIVHDVIARFVDADATERIRLIAPDDVVIEADGSRIDQVLTNLVDNALKYSDEPAEVAIEIADGEEAVTIAVSDRGMGLREVSNERLFEAFGLGLGVEHVPGLGLGLHIASQIVGRHGGRIHASDRTDGPGSVFTIRLPRSTGRAE